MHDRDGINSLWGIFITVSGIAGVINIAKAFQRPTWEDMNKKEDEIEILKKRVKNYQDIINGPDRKNKLE